MMSHLRPALVLTALFTVLTGLAFPLAFVGIGHVVFPRQAAGSLIMQDGKPVGSALLGEYFSQPRYFHGRPSVTTDTDAKGNSIPAPYNAANSSGSNLGPTSKALIDRVADAARAAGGHDVPADAVTTSASGLDPDISPANAASQVARVAAARHLPAAEVQALLARHTETRLLGVIGEPRVNVLRLNIALDAARP